MFTLDDPSCSETHRILTQAHAAQAEHNARELQAHINLLEAMPGVAGVSQHDLLYTGHEGSEAAAEEALARPV